MHGYQISKIASEIVRLSQEQVDLLAAVHTHKRTETQQEGYRLRQRRIFELSAELIDTDVSSTA